MEKKKITAVITDLDNTLFDWFGIWYRCFSPMLREIVRISGISEEQLVCEIRTIHQKYGTSEYAFLIQELPSLKQKHKTGNICEIYHSAIDVYRDNRRKHLRLYPGVMDALMKIKEAGCLIAAYTESTEFYTNYRVRKLGLDGVIDVLYSPRDHKLPDNIERRYPPETYRLTRTVQKYIPENEHKPNPKVLLDIIADIGAPRDEVLYIGDSLSKDIVMARSARVLDVYAQYGRPHRRREYELISRVTHWTRDMVEKEKSVRKEDILPTISLTHNFSEMLNLFDFGSFDRAGKADEGRVRNTVKTRKTTALT